MRLIALVIILGVAKICFGECEYSQSELTLSSEYGNLKPKNYPSYIRGGQTCTWNLPTEKHMGKPLFIYIDEIETAIQNYYGVVVHLGDEPKFYSMPLANCRIYGARITELDSHFLDNLIQKYESEGKYCTGWSVSEKNLETVTFWSYGDKTDININVKFKIIYDYKILKNSVRQTTSTTQTTSIQQSTTSNVGVDKSCTQATTRERQNTIYVMAISLLGIFLVVVSAALAFVMCKLKKANKTLSSVTTTISATAPRQQEITSNIPVENYAAQSRPVNQANPMYQEIRNTRNDSQNNEQNSDPYANIQGGNKIHTSSSNERSNIDVYEVPMIGREMATTAISGFSNPDDPSYQNYRRNTQQT